MSEENAARQRLGKYEVLKVLESDGPNQLYSARDTETGRHVVLRVVAYETEAPAPAPAGAPTPAEPSRAAQVQPARRPVSWAAALAAALLIAAAVALVAYAARHGGLAWLSAKGGKPSTEPVTRQEMTLPPPPPAKSRQQAAEGAFQRALSDWNRYSAKGEYELAIAAFDAVAQAFSETAFADKSREEMARIYTEWGRAEASAGKKEDAVARYAKAIEVAPAGSTAADVARASMPAAMAELADAAVASRDYGRAIKLYEEIARTYPGTKEAALVDRRKPEILLSQAFALWNEGKDLEKALGMLRAVAADYPDTEAARRAQRAMPSLHLDLVRQELKEGKLEEARAHLDEAVQTYAEEEVGSRPAELDAEILFALFQREQAAGNVAEAERQYAELVRRHPSSPLVVRSGRAKLNLEPAKGQAYDADTARNQLKVAQAQYDRLELKAAVDTLKAVIRSADEDSTEAAEALSKLPAWLCESALYAYGHGSLEECEKTLGELSAQFPTTVWEQKSTETVHRIKNAPEGMVYVPEGRFWMGTDTADIIALLRLVHASGLEDDDESFKLSADLYGLTAETPKHVASIKKPFYVDKTEVTNAQYKACLDASGTPPPARWTSGTYPAGDGDLPVTSITQAEAEAYAKWRTARLPTEAEWEKAARGTDGRQFPWGDTFDAKRCQHMRPEEAGPIPVGSFANSPSPYGCLDMIGNVREWTSSPMVPYQHTDWQNREQSTGATVARGGAWFQEELPPIPARCASRYPLDPSKPDRATGFRCVRDVPEPGAGAAGS